MTSSGQLARPWIETKACIKGTDMCKTMIVNPNTNEIARLGDQLNSRFELTGNGQELRRAETALDKAIRLKASQ